MNTNLSIDNKIYFIELAIRIIENGYYYNTGNDTVQLTLIPSHIEVVLNELIEKLKI